MDLSGGVLVTMKDELSASHSQPYLLIDSCDTDSPHHPYELYMGKVATSENIVFVDVLVNDIENIKDDIVIHQLNTIKSVIIQYRSKERTKVYVKDVDKKVEVIDLSVNDELDNERLIEQLNDKNCFGLKLIVSALKSNLIGRFGEQLNLCTASIDLYKKLGEWRLVDFAVMHNDFLLLRFLSLYKENVIELKKHFFNTMKLCITHGSTAVIAALLKLDFPLSNRVIKLPKQTDILIKNIRMMLLKIATDNDKQNVIKLIVQCTPDKELINVLEQLMEFNQYRTVLMCLKADSVHPYIYDTNDIDVKCSGAQQLIDFINSRSHLHSLIKISDFNSIQQLNLNVEESQHYLNMNDESIAFTAIASKQLEMYVHLLSKGFTLRNERERSVQNRLSELERNQLRDMLVNCFSEIGETCITYLLSKSKVVQKQSPTDYHVTIQRYYKTLSQIPEIAAILAVIKHSDFLDVVFDFELDSTHNADPFSNSSTQGVYYPSMGRIYIGAKDDSEVLGTIAHEFTHLAAQMLYNNERKPYNCRDHDSQLQFNEIVCEVKKQIGLDRVIRRAFLLNDPNSWESELIVRVNHILAKYNRDEGLKILQTQVPNLLNYYKQKMLNDCQTFVSESHLIKVRHSLKLLNLEAGVVKTIAQTNILFKNPFNLGEFLMSDNQILIVSTPHTLLSAVAMHQSLAAKYIFYEDYLLVQNEYFMQKFKQMAPVLISEACKVLALIFISDSCLDVGSVIQEMSEILENEATKKLILISRARQKLNEIQLEFPNKIIQLNHFSLLDLQTQSQNYLLEKTIVFQGEKMKLKHLLDEMSVQFVDEEILEKLCKKKKLNIGKAPNISYGYDVEMYMRRSLGLTSAIARELISKDISDSDFLVVQLNKMKVSIVGRAESEFDSMCDGHRDKEYMLLQRKSDRFHLRKSRLVRTDYESLRDYILDDFNKICEEESLICEMNEQPEVIVISDRAGMGKTTLLTHMSQMIKTKYPHFWVINIILNKYTKTLNEEAKQSTFETNEMEKALDFLLNKLLATQNETKCELNFEKHLLRHFIQNCGNAIFMFDGFDELKAEQQEVVIKLIKVLQTTAVKQIWLTTRPHMRKRLENELQRLSYALTPFGQRQQTDYLVKFWTKTLTTETSRVEVYAQCLMSAIKRCLSERDQALTAVPLLLMMVGEVFQARCKTFHDSTEHAPTLPEQLDLLTLYEMFVKKKFHIYHFGKMELEESTQQADTIIEGLYPQFQHEHQIMALLAVFDAKCKAMLADIQTDTEKCLNNKKLCYYGIINEIIDNQPHFVHLTFAEYFAAQFLINSLEKQSKNINFVSLLFNKIIYTDEHEVVTAFMDCHLSNAKLTDQCCTEIGQLIEIPATGNIFHHVEYETTISNWNLASFIVRCVKCKFESDEYFGQLNDINLLHKSIYNQKLEVVKVLHEIGMDLNAQDNPVYQLHPLQVAIIANAVDICEYLLQNGANVNVQLRDKYHYENNLYTFAETPLQFAVLSGREEHVKLLLKYGANVNAICAFNNTSMHSATYTANVEIAKILIDHGADINAVHSGGLTPLSEAILWGRQEFAEYLLNLEDINVNGTNESGLTALHLAAAFGNEHIVAQLLQHGAEINAKANFIKNFGWKEMLFIHTLILLPTENVDATIGSTAIQIAHRLQNNNIAQILIANGAEMYACNKMNAIPNSVMQKRFDYANTFKTKRSLKAIANDDIEMFIDYDEVRYFKFYDVAYDAWDEDDVLDALSNSDVYEIVKQQPDYKSLLLTAAASNYTRVLSFVLKRNKCHVNTADSKNCTALHKAAEKGHLEAVQLLAETYGADVNAVSDGRCTALYLAAEKGHTQIVKLLVNELKADVKASDDYGNTPLHKAAENGHLDTVDCLVRDFKCDVETVNSHGWTAAFSAAQKGRTEIVKLLIKEFNANINAADKDQRTVLHHASRKGNAELVSLLVNELDVDASATSIWQSTALHEAAEMGHVEIVRMLASKCPSSAVIDAVDSHGATALYYAAKEGHTDIVRLLIDEFQADINICNEYGYSMLQVAAIREQDQVIKELANNSSFMADVQYKNVKATLQIAVQKRDRVCANLIEAIKHKIKYKQNQSDL